MSRTLGLAALLVLALASDAVPMDIDFDGKHFHVFKIAASADTAFVTGDFDFNGDSKEDWSRIVGIGWKNGSAAEDSLGYNTGKFVHMTEIPRSSSDFIALDLKNFGTIERAAAQPDTVLRYVANSGQTFLYVFGE